MKKKNVTTTSKKVIKNHEKKIKTIIKYGKYLYVLLRLLINFIDFIN